MPMLIIEGCNPSIVVNMAATRKIDGRPRYASIVMDMTIFESCNPTVVMDVGISTCNSQTGYTEHSMGVTVVKSSGKAVVMNVK